MKGKGFIPILIIISILTISSFNTLPLQGQSLAYVFTDEPCTKEVFSFSMLSPNSNPQQNAIIADMLNEFPKGCIGIDDHFSLDWLTYTARSIYYDVRDIPDKRVPLYVDGGYDLGFVGAGGATLPDIQGSYDSDYTVDVGSNWYNYINSTIDALFNAYYFDTNYDTRDATARKIQRILYEDQPSMMLFEDNNLYAHSQDLLGFGPNEALVFSTYSAQDTYKLLGYSDTSKSVVYAHSYTTSEFSPWSSGNSAIGALYQNAIFQGLYQQAGQDLHLEPLLAQDMPSISFDGLTFNVTLNPNAKFANGNLVRAEDVYDSFLRTFDPQYGSTLIGSYIIRFGDPLDTTSPYYRPVDDIIRVNTAGSGGELSFTFMDPYFAADRFLTFPVVDSTVWGSWDAPLIPYDTNGYIQDNYKGPIGKTGSGPFYYDTIDGTSGNVKLARNDNYWNGPVQAASLDFQFYGEKSAALEDLEAGVVDIVDANLKPSLAELTTLTGVTYILLPAYGWQEMFVNMKHPIFGTGLGTPLGQKDPSRAYEAARYVRQAMSHLVPRDYYVSEILAGIGTPGTTMWINGWMHHDDSLQPYDYSISKAKEFLAKAGYDTHDTIGSSATSSSTPPPDITLNLPLNYSWLFVVPLLPLVIISQKRWQK